MNNCSHASVLKGLRRKALLTAFIVSATLGFAGSVNANVVAEPIPVPSTMAALGDSISQGYNAVPPPGSHPELSWSTGDSEAVESIAQRLDAYSGGQISTLNLSVSGTKIDAIPGQIQQAVEGDAGLITLLSGANDACTPTVDQMTSVHDYRKSFTQAIDIVKENKPEASVLVGSVPDLRKLWAAGTGTPATEVWNLFKICQSVLANPNSHAQADVERRERVHERVKAYNTVLREVCAAYSRCYYDEGALFNLEFTLADLSGLDYFHPGIEGQKKIAALTWPALPWSTSE